MIVSSNKSFSAWGEIFGDPVTVDAMASNGLRTDRDLMPKLRRLLATNVLGALSPVTSRTDLGTGHRRNESCA